MTTHTAAYNGQVFTRRSSHTYTHVVIATPHRGEAIARVHRDATSKAFAQSYWFACREANEATRQSRLTPAEIESFKVIAAQTLDAYRDGWVQSQLSQIEAQHQAGYYDTYEVIGWCGRTDLAVQLAARTRAKPYYGDVQILFATAKP